MAGTVVEVAGDVTASSLGDEVYGMVGGVGGLQGTLAELVAADVDLLARKPNNLSMREAAALPLSTITAWDGLIDRAQVHADQRYSSTRAPAASVISQFRLRVHSGRKFSPQSRRRRKPSSSNSVLFLSTIVRCGSKNT
jgi:hypothetical protein